MASGPDSKRIRIVGRPKADPPCVTLRHVSDEEMAKREKARRDRPLADHTRDPSAGHLPAEGREAEFAALMAEALATTTTKGAGLTVSDWFGKYYDAAELGTVGRKNAGCGQVSAGDRRTRFEHWIEPVVGSLPMATVGPDDLRRS